VALAVLAVALVAYLHGGVVFFSLLGGVAVFGPAGLLAGPLIVAFFLAVVRMCQKELQAA
jgi:predicted PurR-regulated permease PerM